MTCAFFGCGQALGRDNRSGVCKKHLHAPGICRCADCIRAPQDPAHRHTVAGIPVRAATAVAPERTMRDTHPSAPVSLPREPWA